VPSCVFHVVFLKKFVGTPPDQVVPLTPIQQGRLLPVPLKVLRTRLNRGIWEVLVQWDSHTAADATWKLVDQFAKEYPSFQNQDSILLAVAEV
jgi:hypothetical protein